MSRLAFFLLGPPRIECNGEPIEIRRRKAMALIVYLAVTGRSHSRDALATLFWPEHDQSRARAGLRRALAALKKALRQVHPERSRRAQDAALGEGWLNVDRETVGLNRDAELWLDVDEFQDRLTECQTHGHPQDQVCPACLPLLAEAAALYRDHFLAGFTLRDSPGFDEWQFFQAEGLHDELASALERLARGHSDRGEFERAIAYARRWLALDPLHEPAHRCLMRLYAWSGQRAAALRQYGECERVLQEELGVVPEEETAQVYQAIKESRELPPPSPPTGARKHNLPVQLTPFVGREAVLAEIAERLGDPACRLLTLVGPGGSGKTRLAVKAAEAQIDSYAHGVYFVSLAPLQSVEAIVPTVAQALGFSFYTGAVGGTEGELQQQLPAKQQLLDYVRQKTMLLIMDNFEHLLDGVGLVTEILKTAPDVKILTTSRARLNVQGEHLFPIAGMHFPDREIAEDTTRYSAVKLFLSSARRTQPGFEPTADNLTDVAQICRLVQGMPLGILLAAAWVEMLTPAEIAAEISQSLDFLETDLRDVPERQRSMRAVFDHSWRLLSERERQVFQGLSVFRGGFTRQAVQQVTGASLRELRALVDKSLLHRTPTGRYEVHELLRQYAAEKLDQVPAASEAARDRHCAYYAAALQSWAADLKSARQQAALAEIGADSENAHAAWNWAVERGQMERLDQAMEGLYHFYEWCGRFQEGEAACRMTAEKLAATASGDGLRVLARILTWQSVFSQALGQIEIAGQLLQKGLAILEGPKLADQDTRPEKASVLLLMGRIAFEFDREEARRLFDREEARRLFEHSLALYRELGDRWGTANALAWLGGVARRLGPYDEAKQLHEESLAIRQALGDQRGIAHSLMNLGATALTQGQLEEAERLVRESFAIWQRTSDRVGIAAGLIYLGGTRMALGKFAEAHPLLEKSAAIRNDLGSPSGLAYSNSILGCSSMHLGRYKQARAYVQMGLTLSREAGSRFGIGYSCFLLGSVALAEEAYAEARELLEESVLTYREVGRQDELAWPLATLGIAGRGLGQRSQAGEYLSEALRTVVEIGVYMPLTYALPAIALLLADQGEKERAVELYALASRYPHVANSRWFEDVAGRHIAAVAATLPPDVVAAAQARGRARDLEATVAELLVELAG